VEDLSGDGCRGEEYRPRGDNTRKRTKINPKVKKGPEKAR